MRHEVNGNGTDHSDMAPHIIECGQKRIRVCVPSEWDEAEISKWLGAHLRNGTKWRVCPILSGRYVCDTRTAPVFFPNRTFVHVVMESTPESEKSYWEIFWGTK